MGGSRCGQRQEFGPDQRVRFGRHPDNEVSFDARRDLDASTRHAELGRHGEAFVLRDIGSSNGTYVGDQRVEEVTLVVGVPIVVEFGPGGPRARIVVGDDQAIAALPEVRPAHRNRARLRLALAVAALLVAALIVAIGWRFAR